MPLFSRFDLCVSLSKPIVSERRPSRLLSLLAAQRTMNHMITKGENFEPILVVSHPEHPPVAHVMLC